MNNYINSKTSTLPLFLIAFFLFNWNSAYSQNNLLITGQLKTEYGRGISDVAIGTTTSDADGQYVIDTFVTAGNSFTFTPEKNTFRLNGVSTDDLIEIGKVILAVETPSSPYRLLAADANGNGLVSTFDMVLIRRMLLQIPQDTTLKVGWKFVRSNFIFPDPLNPFSSTLPEVFSVNSPDTLNDIDFIGYKMGDYTGNAAPNLFNESEDRSYTDELALSINNQRITQGETQTVFLQASEDLELNGFQFSLQFDPAFMEVTDIQAADTGLKETHAGMSRAAEGKIHLLAYQTNGKSIKAQDALLQMTIKAKRDLTLSQVLQIGESHLQPEVYPSQQETAKLKLEYKAIPTTSNIASKSTVFPNPFQDQTTLNFHLMSEGMVTLTITDQSGRLISRQAQWMQTGDHQWTLSNEALSTEKLFFYHLEGPALHTSGRLIREK